MRLKSATWACSAGENPGATKGIKNGIRKNNAPTETTVMAKKTGAEKLKLAVEKRKLTGRQVKKLRQEGILPANIFGKKIKSQAVQVSLKDFLPVWEKAGETGLVEIKVTGEDKVRPILLHNLQLDAVTDKPLHADFYQVDLKEKITSEIPVELIGEAPAVIQKVGILIQPLSEVEVEALPTDLPDQFTVDISKLEKIDDAITVAVLKAPAGVKILTSPKQILVKIEPLAKEEVVAPPPVAEAAPAEGEKVEEKPAEEGKPVEGKPAETPQKPAAPAEKPTEKK